MALKKPKAEKKMSSGAKVLEFFLGNVGRVVTSDQIRKASGASEWARRLRELRNEQGWQILSHRDRASLKPGQYILESMKRNPAFGRNISNFRPLIFGTSTISTTPSRSQIGSPQV